MQWRILTSLASVKKLNASSAAFFSVFFSWVRCSAAVKKREVTLVALGFSASDFLEGRPGADFFGLG